MVVANMELFIKGLVVSVMLAVALSVYIVEDLEPKVTVYLYWFFVAASLVKFPEPQIVPEIKDISTLKLQWRGHLL